MAQRFERRTVLITGAASGMGASHAKGFIAEGANVVLGDINDGAGAALAADLGERARYIHLDVSDPDQWSAAVAFAEDAFGPIGVLVNNAGFGSASPVADTSTEDWRYLMSVNLDGTFFGIRASVPSLRKNGGGAIVNISSYAGLAGTPLAGAYTASKFAVRGLTKVAAFELGPDNIRVNSIHPGYIDTPILQGYGAEVFGLPGKVAIPRLGRAEEVTAMVLFVCSDDASYSTGSEFVVDGGWASGSPIPIGSSEPLAT